MKGLEGTAFRNVWNTLNIERSLFYLELAASQSSFHLRGNNHSFIFQ